MSLMRANVLRLRRPQGHPEAILACQGSRVPSTRRNFAAGTLSAATTWTAEAICSVHQAGLPWYLTIPLVAVGVNFTMRLPLQWYSMSVPAKQKELVPILRLWQFERMRRASEQPPSLDPSEVRKLQAKTRRRLFRDFGCQTWKTYTPLLTTIPFYIISVSLRRIAGAGSSTTSAPGTLLDPSIVEGGLAWFTDLSVHDPYFILPMMCSGLLAANVWRGLDFKEVFKGFFKGESLSLASDSPDVVLRKGGQRLLLFVPLLPVFFAYSPSAMLLYWVTTFGLTNVNRSILNRVQAKPTSSPGNSMKDGESTCLHSAIHKQGQTSW